MSTVLNKGFTFVIQDEALGGYVFRHNNTGAYELWYKTQKGFVFGVCLR